MVMHFMVLRSIDGFGVQNMDNDYFQLKSHDLWKPSVFHDSRDCCNSYAVQVRAKNLITPSIFTAGGNGVRSLQLGRVSVTQRDERVQHMALVCRKV